MTKLKTYIFRDQGVSPFSYCETLASLIESVGNFCTIEPIDCARLCSGNWIEETSLLVFPGGRDLPYHEALQGQGNRHIREFVEKGGSFLGICAGAYYAASQVCFSQGTPLEVVAERELKFYPGTAKGPLYDPLAFSYQSESGARAASIGFGERQLYAYYNGGCAFLAPQEHLTSSTVMARYLDLATQPAAVVACQVGEGVALLSGVHLEYRLRSMNILHAIPEVVEQLAKTEELRQEIFREIASYLIARSIKLSTHG